MTKTEALLIFLLVVAVFTIILFLVLPGMHAVFEKRYIVTIKKGVFYCDLCEASQGGSVIYLSGCYGDIESITIRNPENLVIKDRWHERACARNH